MTMELDIPDGRLFSAVSGEMCNGHSLRDLPSQRGGTESPSWYPLRWGARTRYWSLWERWPIRLSEQIRQCEWRSIPWRNCPTIEDWSRFHQLRAPSQVEEVSRDHWSNPDVETLDHGVGPARGMMTTLDRSLGHAFHQEYQRYGTRQWTI